MIVDKNTFAIIEAMIGLDLIDEKLGGLGPMGRHIDDLREHFYNAINESPEISLYVDVTNYRRDDDKIVCTITNDDETFDDVIVSA